MQAPTARNAVLKYGSWAGFFQHHGLDLLALQVGRPFPIAIMLVGRRFAACCRTPPAAAPMQPRTASMSLLCKHWQSYELQESKVIEDKLTKELACVDGFQSFWACSR